MKKTYTWEEMYNFLMIYEDKDYTNLDSFVLKLKELRVPEKESTLMWQIFDVAEFYFK